MENTCYINQDVPQSQSNNLYKILFYVIVFLLITSNSLLIYKNNTNIKNVEIEKNKNIKISQELNQKNNSLSNIGKNTNSFKELLTDSKNYFDINYPGDDFCKITDPNIITNSNTICEKINPSHKIYPLFSKIRYGSVKELNINNLVFLLTPNYFNQSATDIKNIDYSEYISGIGDPWSPIYTNKDIIIWGGGTCGSGFRPLEGTDPHFQERLDQCEGLRTKIENLI